MSLENFFLHESPLSRGLKAIGALPLVFVLSLLLSYLALLDQVTPNADGMLYVDAARLLLSDGLAAAQQLYDWLFLSVLIAGLSLLTGLEMQVSGYLLAAVLMASVGVVLVGICRDLYPSATWAAVVVVLALPALNNYRDFIIREHGSWLFTLLSLWLLIRWLDSRRLLLIFGSQISLLVATLFRPESLAFLGVPFLWLLFSRRSGLSWRDLGPFLILPSVGVVILFVAVVGFDLQIAGKIVRQLQAVNLADQIEAFHAAADRVGSQLSHYVMGTDARRLLFFGLLSLIPIKLLTNFGLLVVPFAYAHGKQNRAKWLSAAGIAPLLWASVLYALILAGLVFEIYFMQARFLALLNLLLVPVLAFGLWRLWLIAGKWRWLIGALALVSVVDGVYTSSPPHSRYQDSADWILSEQLDRQRIFFESPEVAYLAGTVHRIHPSMSCLSRELLLGGGDCQGRFDVYVIRSGWEGDDVLAWADANGFALLKEFTDRRRRVVYIFERPSSP